MTATVLKKVSKAMHEMGIAYGFGVYGGEEYPYFVGEYAENTPTTEDGLQTGEFTLTGWHRGTWQELTEAKDKIEDFFDKVNGYITIDGNAVAIFYSKSTVVPTDDAELKRVEIHLDVKEWKVN